MRSRLWIVAFVLGWISVTPAWASPPQVPAARAPARPAAATRWMWMTGMGGPFLVFYYVDRMAGPSAKGAHVSDPPTAKELEAVINTPAHTFRDPVSMGARTLSAAELAAIKLPDRPSWLDIFEPPGTPPPPMPKTAGTGRPPAPKDSVVMLEYACGPRSGGAYMIVGARETLEVGASVPRPGQKRIVISEAGVREQHAVVTNTDGLAIAPVGDAKVVVNGKPIAAATRLAIGDHIDIGKTTLIPRDEGYELPHEPYPSCPGVADMVWIEDGCFMYGSSRQRLLGGDEVVVGTDTPERTGFPEAQWMRPAVRVRLFNHKGKIELTALDPKHLPKVKGRPVAKGTLSVGGSIEIGDRVFAIAGDDRHSVLEAPMPICPEARIKAEKHAKRGKPRR
jgi:hypothetical protein